MESLLVLHAGEALCRKSVKPGVLQIAVHGVGLTLLPSLWGAHWHCPVEGLATCRDVGGTQRPCCAISPSHYRGFLTKVA